MNKMPTPQEFEARKQERIRLIQVQLDLLDSYAYHIELKWGRDVLPTLVPEELRKQFERQQLLTNEAIASDDLKKIELHCPALIRGWEVLDKVADERHPPKPVFQDDIVKEVMKVFPKAVVTDVSPKD